VRLIQCVRVPVEDPEANDQTVPQSEDLSNHQAYVKNWLQALRNDDRFIFKASTAASKAVDFILSFSRQPEPEEVPF